MNANSTQERMQVHALLDLLPEHKLNAIRSLLEVMIEPLSHTLADVPEDDGELTPETVKALGRAKESLKRGEGIAHEEIIKEFGLQQ